MTPEIFNARMVQIQLERDAINTLVHGMNSENLFRATLGHDLTYTMTEFDQAKHSLMQLGRGIDNLINEYQAGEKPAPIPSEWESKARRVMAGMLLFIEANVNHDLGLNTGGTIYSKATIREDVIALLGLKEDDDKLMVDCNGEGTGK
jgi:hypothetical protein